MPLTLLLLVLPESSRLESLQPAPERAGRQNSGGYRKLSALKTNQTSQKYLETRLLPPVGLNVFLHSNLIIV
jgi:hypothetical protein